MGHPLDKPERPAMREALKLRHARKGPPTEADAPPPSTFPMTPAARQARDMSRGKRRA